MRRLRLGKQQQLHTNRIKWLLGPPNPVAWSGVGPASASSWLAQKRNATAVKFLAGYWGRRVTSQFTVKSSPRKDQNGEWGRTPFGSRGVPLESPVGQQMQFHCRFTIFLAFPGRIQHSAFPRQGPKFTGVGGQKGHFIAVVYCVVASEDAADAGPTQHQGS